MYTEKFLKIVNEAKRGDSANAEAVLANIIWNLIEEIDKLQSDNNELRKALVSKIEDELDAEIEKRFNEES